MPTTPSCQSGDESTSAGGGGSGTMRDRRLEHRRLDRLPLAVELVEPERQRQRRVAVGAPEQLERERGVFEPAGGVEPRRQAEADGAGVDRRPAGRRRPPAAPRAPAAARCAAGRARSPASTRFSSIERHDVGDGADGDHVGERPQRQRERRRSSSPGLLEQRVGQLEGDADAGQMRARIAPAASGVTTTQSGRSPSISWWSVTMTSMPSACARATSARALMPQSTVISSLTPAAASSSTAAAETP